MKYIILAFLLHIASFAFIISVGGFDGCYKGGKIEYKNRCPYKQRKDITISLHKELPNVNSFTVWITRDWKENWYPATTINTMVQKGYTPIFIFYYFADDISASFVKKHKNRYFYALQRFIHYLKKIRGKKIVVLNPEYNENGMSDNKDFDLLNVISIIKIKNTIKNALVGPCVGDFGEYTKIWDQDNWDAFTPSLHFSAKVADFIAFQEMRALTRNTKEEILLTPKRILALTTYLWKKYKKPTLLAYLAISSYKDPTLQTKVLQELRSYLPILKQLHFLGFGWFNYIDNPEHRGYFNKAEKYWGLKTYDGTNKDAFGIFATIE